MVRLLLRSLLTENCLPSCFWSLRGGLRVRVDSLGGQDARHFHEGLQVLEAAGLPSIGISFKRSMMTSHFVSFEALLLSHKTQVQEMKFTQIGFAASALS